jgi:hypothetical protein
MVEALALVDASRTKEAITKFRSILETTDPWHVPVLVCCYTVVTLVLHCCYTVITLLLHCCHIVVITPPKRIQIILMTKTQKNARMRIADTRI